MLNALSGAMKDETNAAYDPRNNNCMCINGQLMLLDLIEHLEVVPGLELIQSNTDGLIIWIPDTDEAFEIETNSASEPWLWDVFSFVNGIIHVNEVKVSGSKKVNLINRVKIVSPTFTCSTAMKVTHEGNTYSLPAGETTVYDIRLQEGDNYVTFTGNGTVKISYRGGSL